MMILIQPAERVLGEYPELLDYWRQMEHPDRDDHYGVTSPATMAYMTTETGVVTMIIMVLDAKRVAPDGK